MALLLLWLLGTDVTIDCIRWAVPFADKEEDGMRRAWLWLLWAFWIIGAPLASASSVEGPRSIGGGSPVTLWATGISGEPSIDIGFVILVFPRAETVVVLRV